VTIGGVAIGVAIGLPPVGLPLAVPPEAEGGQITAATGLRPNTVHAAAFRFAATASPCTPRRAVVDHRAHRRQAWLPPFLDGHALPSLASRLPRINGFNRRPPIPGHLVAPFPKPTTTSHADPFTRISSIAIVHRRLRARPRSAPWPPH
jgi:hypothetical protein